MVTGLHRTRIFGAMKGASDGGLSSVPLRGLERPVDVVLLLYLDTSSVATLPTTMRSQFGQYRFWHRGSVPCIPILNRY